MTADPHPPPHTSSTGTRSWRRAAICLAAGIASVAWLAVVLASEGALENGIHTRAPAAISWLSTVDHYDRIPALVRYYADNAPLLLVTAVLPLCLLWIFVLRAAPMPRPQAAQLATVTCSVLILLAIAGTGGAAWYMAQRMTIWDVRYAEHRQRLARQQPVEATDGSGRAVPALYAARYGNFLNAPAVAGADIVFVGDSITEPIPWHEFFPALTALNRGIGNDTIDGVRNRLAEIDRHKPKVVSLMIGLNDIWPSTSPDDEEKMFARYQALVAAIAADRIVLHPILPIRITDEADRPVLTRSLQKIAAFNDRLAELCDGRRTICTTVPPAMIAADGELVREMTVDGVHLSGRGAMVWIEHIRALPALQALAPRRAADGN